MTEANERREHPRQETPSVTYRSARPEVFSRILDMSLGGIRVLAPVQWDIGFRMAIGLEVPNRAPLKMTVEVVWSKPAANGEWEIGLRFVNVNDYDRYRLASVLGSSAGQGSI